MSPALKWPKKKIKAALIKAMQIKLDLVLGFNYDWPYYNRDVEII